MTTTSTKHITRTSRALPWHVSRSAESLNHANGYKSNIVTFLCFIIVTDQSVRGQQSRDSLSVATFVSRIFAILNGGYNTLVASAGSVTHILNPEFIYTFSHVRKIYTTLSFRQVTIIR